MSRVIRRVPKNWEHPKYIKTHLYPGEGYKAKIRYKPMYQEDYQEAVKEHTQYVRDWFDGYEYWQKGIYWSSFNNKKKPKEKAFKEWLASIEKDRKSDGFDGDYRAEERMKYETGICLWEDIAGKVPSLPNPDDYMPFGEWYQLFETVSEGTPLSPPFETPEELIEWLVNNKDYWGNQWTKQQAEAIIKYKYAPSFVVANGKVHDSQESLLINVDEIAQENEQDM